MTYHHPKNCRCWWLWEELRLVTWATVLPESEDQTPLAPREMWN